MYKLRIRHALAMCVVAACFPLGASADSYQASLPLHDGHFSARHLAESLASDLHCPSAVSVLLPSGDLSVDLRGVNNWLTTRALNNAIGDGFQISVTDASACVRIDPAKCPANLDQTSDALGRFTRVAAPQAVTRQERRFGLFLPASIDSSKPLVVLIHGLDGDAESCKDLATLLGNDGFQTAIFSYPAERPLDETTRLLRKHLEFLHQQHPNLIVDLVTESMGGLIARNYVESPEFTGGIDRLIMVAPPNAGSNWAKLAICVKVAVNVADYFHDPDWSPAWMITEGLCQSARDLHPGSSFLSALNSRARRPGVRYTIIAGDRPAQYRFEANLIDLPTHWVPHAMAGCWGVRQIDATLHRQAENLLARQDSSDGPVPLSSAQLAGVKDFVALPADHIALFQSIDHEPPAAWSIIENRLRN